MIYLLLSYLILLGRLASMGLIIYTDFRKECWNIEIKEGMT
ncbi:hypothetical protein [Enterococcus durans]|nr:hypothetical protein [Enterococcus durans]